MSQLPSLLQKITDTLQLDLQVQFGVSAVNELPLSRLKEWLALAKQKIETLPDWVRYRLKRDDLNQGGLRPLVGLIDEEAIDADKAELLFDLVYNEHVLRQLYEDRPTLATFSGVAHQTTRERFCDADHKMIEATRDEVSNFHRSQIPGGAIGGMKVLRHEIQKKTRHKSIRRLLKESGPAIQNIKPVFMMSPMSIAQYLEPGAVEFDLLLIDEASQIEPVDALGAIARCKQIVVVGDDKQLPPTKFFSRSAEVDDDNESDTVRELESILGVCNARGLPQRMLMWHYRSQHQSLIAVSNKEYYDNQLFVVPSPIRDNANYGVKFQLVEDGVYDRGGKASNAIEARVVAKHVIEHARNYPQLSLGVAAFSIKQRDAINNELELLLREHLDVAPFFQQTGRDAFFTKNLETIQGDERDVIFISVGYGRDADGYMTQSYGPLNRDGGERRLNVLISRAKQKCVVFSSITSEDIDLNRAKARGVAGLKKYLQFAQHGYSDIGEVTGREHDSEFEREVANAIAGYGHTVEAQVGVAGFFIDLAVVDPQSTGRYLLGIECDGASYHSSQSARDRDRLREEVLRNRGWQIHRIWSTDWYQQPDTELKKVLTAIELAQRGDLSHATAPERDTSIEVTSASHDDLYNEIDDLPSDDQQPSPVESTEDPFGIPVERYHEASFEIVSATSVLDMQPATLDKAVLEIVDFEGPVHRDEVARRLASLTNTRAGSRITDVVKKTITRLIRKNEVTRTGEFVDLPDSYILVVRNRSQVKSPSLKKPENIPPQELALAMALLLKQNSNAEKEELIRAVSSVVGFRRTGAKFNEAVESVINEMVASGEFVIRDGVLSVGDWEKCELRLNI
jgi:very-short-patch-repair endonuclease